MGQVKSRLSDIFGIESGNSNNRDCAQNVTNKKYPKFIDSTNKENAENDSLNFPFGILATPRNPLKRSRQTSPTVSLPQSITDIFSPAKKPRIEDDYLDFPFLENKETIDFYRKSKIMIILRGLPGSGKSTIANHIQRKHISCKICSADNFFMKDGEYVYDRSLIKEAHAQCQENAIKAVQDQVSVVVIDNTNLKLWEMNFYLNLAKKFHYVPIIVESQTPWRSDVSQLVSKTIHNIDEHIMELKKNDFDVLKPFYYGWFLNEKDSYLFIEEGKMWIEVMSKIPEFTKDMQHFTGTRSLEDLLDYYKPTTNGILHCTASYVGKKNSPEHLKYAEKCHSLIGKCFDIEVIGFVITPRTIGARVRLSKEQLLLWENDDNEDVPQEFFEDNFSNCFDDDNDFTEISVSKNSGVGNILQHLQNKKDGICTESGNTTSIPQNNSINLAPEFSDSNGVVNDTDETDTIQTSSINNSISNSNIINNGFENVNSDILEISISNSDSCVVDSINKSWETNDTPKKQDYKNRHKLGVHSFNVSPSKRSPRKNKSGLSIPENTISIEKTLTRETVSLVVCDISEEKKFIPTCGIGSRAHLTLGCAPDAKPVTTGLDLIMTIQKETSSLSSKTKSDHQNSSHDSTFSPVSQYEIEGAIVRNYGNGVWVVYLNDIINVKSVFSGCY